MLSTTGVAPRRNRHSDIPAYRFDEEPSGRHALVQRDGRSGPFHEFVIKQKRDTERQRRRAQRQDEIVVRGARIIDERKQHRVSAQSKDFILRRGRGAIHLGMGT